MPSNTTYRSATLEGCYVDHTIGWTRCLQTRLAAASREDAPSRLSCTVPCPVERVIFSSPQPTVALEPLRRPRVEFVELHVTVEAVCVVVLREEVKTKATTWGPDGGVGFCDGAGQRTMIEDSEVTSVYGPVDPNKLEGEESSHHQENKKDSAKEKKRKGNRMGGGTPSFAMNSRDPNNINSHIQGLSILTGGDQVTCSLNYLRVRNLVFKPPLTNGFKLDPNVP
nr:uncharacterized protein LOC128694399 [Cherax quadricarinatus]